MPWRPNAVFGFAECAVQAQALAKALNIPYETIAAHTFPDGESKIRIQNRATSAIVYRPLHQPNAKLIELILAAAQLRDAGTSEMTLIAPYLPYMRQDIAFHPGEAVSQKIIGKLLSGYFDRFVAVDPHLHRTPRLDDVFQGKPALALSGAPAIASHLRAQGLPANALVIGPDEESAPLTRAVGEPLKLPWATCVKVRKGDRDVRIAPPPDVDFNGRGVIIVDDVISSGTTIASLAKMARDAGAESVDVYATHALFDDDVHDMLIRTGVRRIISCDGIPHRTNDMPVVDLIMTGLNVWL